MTIAPSRKSALVARLDVPPTGAGTLDSLHFGVKDLIDVAGTVTGCGNPTWGSTHPLAVVHAVCVEQLLRAGGQGMADHPRRAGRVRRRFAEQGGGREEGRQIQG